ncbi:uncharacterized protein YesV [Paraliobacillus ryukyuensis]|uniref:Putative membrane protein YesL n=1 Tax=Paraliobacillus ryukyuensis TaxID=200904 RepID=A0A366EDM7_9BACI|nr:DUF624 domain-containing protein [Paraliobacillus ryukyuensis]RBP00418.1 putative membrane protein YesL [Paraliobacillus ryukyuensis]
MNGKSITTTLDLVFRWITKLAFVNLLWIFFSFVGLGILGIFPATIATLGVVRSWLKGNTDVKIWSTFKQIYKQEFKYANTLGLILVIAGILLYFNFIIIQQAQGEFPFVIPFLFYFVLFLYLCIVIWSFPLTAHNYASVFQQLKNALILGITKIHITIILILLLFSITYFSLDYPVLLLFFTFGLLGLAWMWFTFRVFVKIFK